MMGKTRIQFNDGYPAAMNDDESETQDRAPNAGPARDLPAAALRAMAEAKARRDAANAQAVAPREIGGRGGEDPVRYGDWEVKGLASDF